MRNSRWIWIVLCALVGWPPSAGQCASKKYKKNKVRMTAVQSPIEDRAGHDADSELDFKRLTAQATHEELVLTAEFWTAWEDVPGPRDANIHLYFASPRSKLFLPRGYHVIMDDEGGVQIAPGSNGGTWVDDRKTRVWSPEDGVASVSLDGETLRITLPWDALPYDSLWLRLVCLHAMEVDDPDTPEVETEFKGGASNPVPSDDCPNDGKALAVDRPPA